MPEPSTHRAVFLDRDGTIIKDQVYSVDPDLLRPLPGAIEALLKLQEAGYMLVVVTNQSGIARGLFAEDALLAFHRVMVESFAERGVNLTAVYYCPHYEQGKVQQFAVACDCRKPAPGMLLRAAAEHGIDLEHSWIVGDRPADTGAGRAAGCRTIGVLTGPESPVGDVPPDFIVPDIAAAAEIILNAE